MALLGAFPDTGRLMQKKEAVSQTAEKRQSIVQRKKLINKNRAVFISVQQSAAQLAARYRHSV